MNRTHMRYICIQEYDEYEMVERMVYCVFIENMQTVEINYIFEKDYCELTSN